MVFAIDKFNARSSKKTTQSSSQRCVINIKFNDLNRERRRSEGIGRRELFCIIWLAEWFVLCLGLLMHEAHMIKQCYVL